MGPGIPGAYDRRDVISGGHGYPEANAPQATKAPQVEAELRVLRNAVEFNRKQMERLMSVIPGGPLPTSGSDGNKPADVLCPLAEELRTIRIIVEEANCILNRVEL